jgi:hypothetical protein
VEGRPFFDRVVAVLLSLVGTCLVAAGGFGCQLVASSSSASDAYTFRGYGVVNGDGTTSCARLSDVGPLDNAGHAATVFATAAGVATTILPVLHWLFPSRDAADSRPWLLSLGTAVAAFVAAAASAAVALLGLFSSECREEGHTCSPAEMAYVAVGGALCFASAGTVLCYTAKNKRHEPRQIELAACEYAVVLGTAANMMQGRSFFDETEIPVAVAVAISPAAPAAAGGVGGGKQ